MHQDGRAGRSLELFNSAHVIDMSMCGHNVLGLQIVPGKYFLDPPDLIAGVDHDSFTARFITKDRAVALQQADGKNFVDHFMLNSSRDLS